MVFKLTLEANHSTDDHGISPVLGLSHLEGGSPAGKLGKVQSLQGSVVIQFGDFSIRSIFSDLERFEFSGELRESVLGILQTHVPDFGLRRVALELAW